MSQTEKNVYRESNVSTSPVYPENPKPGDTRYVDDTGYTGYINHIKNKKDNILLYIYFNVNVNREELCKSINHLN